MSWIFSFLLIGYALVRLVLRVRGQFRWLAIRDTLPEPPPIVAAPRHLSAALAQLFVDSLTLRADLVTARRTLAAVAVQDPDAPLGRVRDARYRRSLMDGWTRIHAWLRVVDQLDHASVDTLADLQIGSGAIAGLRDSLRDSWTTVARSRALDPFALDQLVGVQQAFERVEAELERIELALTHVAEHPYRDRATLA